MSRTKLNGRSGKKPATTATEALSILQSALGYCQKAGIEVRAYNWPDGMTLFIGNAHFVSGNNGTYAELRIGTVPANQGTPQPATTLEASVSAHG